LDVQEVIPELRDFARLDVEVLMNKDSSEMDGKDWVTLARALHERREEYSAFVVAHGTDTMAYAASALSLMLVGFGKPIVLTGSQLPLSFARSDARQNLIDALTCCCASRSCGGTVDFAEVAICFGGKLLRGNRASKTSATVYAAFSSPSYPALARLGVGVDWNHARLLRPAPEYAPQFELNSNVIRVPVIPGLDIEKAYGDLYGRGVRGIILEAFGVGNFPQSLVPWLTSQASRGLQIYLSTQCQSGVSRRGQIWPGHDQRVRRGQNDAPHRESRARAPRIVLWRSRRRRFLRHQVTARASFHALSKPKSSPFNFSHRAPNRPTAPASGPRSKSRTAAGLANGDFGWMTLVGIRSRRVHDARAHRSPFRRAHARVNVIPRRRDVAQVHQPQRRAHERRCRAVHEHQRRQGSPRRDEDEFRPERDDQDARRRCWRCVCDRFVDTSRFRASRRRVRDAR